MAERMSACSVVPILEQKSTGTVTDSSTGKTVGAAQQTARDYTCGGLLLKQTFRCAPPDSRVKDSDSCFKFSWWMDY